MKKLMMTIALLISTTVLANLEESIVDTCMREAQEQQDQSDHDFINSLGTDELDEYGIKILKEDSKLIVRVRARTCVILEQRKAGLND